MKPALNSAIDDIDTHLEKIFFAAERR